ncbi:MAG: DUF3047 domain-containing protein [Deltaproteobacteria bacterium]|nr:DUF3047 domain-containing protein [Deltaproteobacteria bacterium]
MCKKVTLLLVSFVLLPFLLFSGDTRHRVNVKIPIDSEWKRLPQYSGPDIYYKILNEDGVTFLRAHFKPEQKTTIFYRKLPKVPQKYKKIKFKWRVYKFPEGANETIEGRMDSAASVYLFFKDGIKKYVIKYIFSMANKKGFNFRASDSNFLNKLHIVVLEDRVSEVGKWLEYEINFYDDFKKYFEREDVPQFMGIGVLSDGDGTKKEVIADYADFILIDTSCEGEATEDTNLE